MGADSRGRGASPQADRKTAHTVIEKLLGFFGLRPGRVKDRQTAEQKALNLQARLDRLTRELEEATNAMQGNGPDRREQPYVD